jgi:hypothetical protein
MSDKWRELDPLDRACILLVAEGVKPGSTFGSKYRSDVESILEKLKLSYLPPEWHRYDYIYTIARDDKTLSDYIRKLLDKNLNVKQAHRAHGLFYGFPQCCIDKYVGSTLVFGKDYIRKRSVPFNKHLKGNKRLNMDYPDELNYIIPGFTPCKADCSKAVELSRKYKEVLLEYDRDAAEELRLFNKRGYRILRY